MYFLFRKKSINYLGVNFSFDHYLTPLRLMLYPEEIQGILSRIAKPKTVLDIGGNIGQFAVTFEKLSPNSKIDSFEPHPASFELLKFNTSSMPNIHAFNFGVGKKGKQDLYYSPQRSVNASLIESNSVYIVDSKKRDKVTVEITDNIASKTGIKKYDLIKVDVEGYEYQTVKRLNGLTAKYMYIEITGKGREKDYNHSELFKSIRETFGDFDILGTQRASSSKFEALLEFEGEK